MTYIRVDEQFFNKLLNKTLNHNETCTCNHTHNHGIILTKDLPKRAKKHNSILKKGVQRQVDTVQKHYNDNKDEIYSNPDYSLQELQDELDIQTSELFYDTNGTLGDTFKGSKKLACKQLRRKLTFRGVDDLDLDLLKQYNSLMINRLIFDVQDALFRILKESGIKGMDDVIVNMRYADFVHSEVIRGGFQTANLRMNLISNDVTKRTESTGFLQAFMDYGLTSVNIEPAGDNPCNDCIDFAINSPWYIAELNGQYPLHPNCECACVKVPGMMATRNPIPNPGSVDLVSFQNEWDDYL